MSVMQSPASIGSVGATNPELATSFRRAQWRMLLAAMFCYLFFYTGFQWLSKCWGGVVRLVRLTDEPLQQPEGPHSLRGA